MHPCRFDALESHRHHPFRMAQYKIGGEVEFYTYKGMDRGLGSVQI